MKNLFTTVALGVLLLSGAYAQDTVKKERRERTEQSKDERTKKRVRAYRGTPEEQAGRQAEKLSDRLDLSDAQKSQLQALNMKRTQELQALNEKYDKSDVRNAAQRAERRAIQERWHAEMKNILNEKQYAEYEADRKEKRDNFRKKGKERVQVQKKVKATREN